MWGVPIGLTPRELPRTEAPSQAPSQEGKKGLGQNEGQGLPPHSLCVRAGWGASERRLEGVLVCRKGLGEQGSEAGGCSGSRFRAESTVSVKALG